MELSAHAADGSGSDCSCPICLESMTRSESKIYPLPCLNCDFNFCSNCVESFCRASEDDFQMASDGSRQVKIHVACPQCRSKYPLEDLEDTVLLLRSAHELAEAIMIRQYDDEEEEPSGGGLEETKENDPGSNNGAKKPQYRLLRDSELSSSQLARKSEFASLDVRKHLEDAFLQYEEVMAKRTLKLDKATLESDRKQRENARAMWEALLDQLPADPDNICTCENPPDCDGSCGNRNSIEVVLQTGSYSPNSSPKSNKKPVVDESLFQGFDEFINRDEQVFLTDLFTNGEVRSVSQAALIMNGVRRLALSGKHKIIRSQSDGPPMTQKELQRHIDRIDQIKIQFPLPNHMPGYFLIPTYSYKEGYMTLKDKPWDGSMTPPQRSKRVFEQVYKKHYKRPQRSENYPLTVATVQAVRGPIGRLGLRRDDIITHVEDAEWHGTAADLQAYIYDCHAKHPRNEISITVNANAETCEFLKVRHEMMQRKAREEKERKKQKALINKAKNAVAKNAVQSS